MNGSQKYRDLINILEEFDLACLAEKFAKGGVTTNILWELDEEILDEIELTKLEKLKYKKASDEWKKKSLYHEENIPIIKKNKNIELSFENHDMQENVTEGIVNSGNIKTILSMQRVILDILLYIISLILLNCFPYSYERKLGHVCCFFISGHFDVMR